MAGPAMSMHVRPCYKPAWWTVLRACMVEQMCPPGASAVSARVAMRSQNFVSTARIFSATMRANCDAARKGSKRCLCWKVRQVCKVDGWMDGWTTRLDSQACGMPWISWEATGMSQNASLDNVKNGGGGVPSMAAHTHVPILIRW
eukprot:360407-Chlamydomonas_euryale.AAC.4